jgi:DNA-binding CsgD family transcriptional regulator
MKDIIIKMVKSGLTYKQISKELGCSLSTISYHCKSEGIVSKNISKKIDDLIIQKMKELYEIEKSSLKVAKILGVSKSTVLKYIETKEYLSESEVRKNKVKSVIYWRRKAKIKLVDYKGGKCNRCGYNKCIDALEFHHLDPNEKDFTISGKSWSFERLREEVDKCILVCSNCHKEIHYNKK